MGFLSNGLTGSNANGAPFGGAFGGGKDAGASGNFSGGFPLSPGGMGGGGVLGFMSGGNTPQDRGFGISDPSAFSPYSTGPGLRQPNQSQAGELSNPGMGEQVSMDLINRFGGWNMPHSATTQYNSLVQNMPTLSADPGFSSFYDNARRRADEDINKQMAARGMYSSSAAGDQISEANMNLAADEAKNRAAYSLARSGDSRAWQGLANQSALQSDQDILNWMSGLAGLGSASQNMQQGRLQQMFGNVMGLDQAMSGIAGQEYGGMMGSDQQLLDAVLASELGLGQQAANQSDQKTQQERQNLMDTMSIMSMGMGGGMI